MQTSALQFQCLTHLRLELRIKKKIQKEIIVTFYESDFKHLVGVQKLYSEIAGLRQYNATKFFYDVLRSEKIYDTVIASPQYFLIKERVELVGNIRNIIHNQYSVFDYIPKPGKRIIADYFLKGTFQGKETYLFLRRRKAADDYACVSVFYKDMAQNIKNNYEYNQRPYYTILKYIRNLELQD